MAVYYDNPAGRLHRILEALRSIDPGSTPCSEAWAQVLDVPTRESVELARRMVQVLQLPQQISQQVKSVADRDFDLDFALRWYEPVERTLAESLFTMDSIDSITRGYDQAVLGALENCSFVLHRFRPEPSASDDELAAIRKLIDELEAELKTSHDIDADIRAFLWMHVRAMAQALDDFAVLGSEGLIAQFDQMVGALIRRKDILVRADAAEAEREDPVWKKVWMLLARLATVLSISVNVMTIGTAIENPPASPPVVVQINPPHNTGGGGQVSPDQRP